MFYFDWMIRVLFRNSICIILATDDYTEWQELNQFETITHGYSTCGIYLPVLFFYILTLTQTLYLTR
jgi:hypothetical protein